LPLPRSHSNKAFAEVALQQIKALRQPASPRNFEIWYQYATGYTPELNRSINETLAQKGTLGEADIDQIYNTYLSPNRVSDRLDTLGSRIAGESDVDNFKAFNDKFGHLTGDQVLRLVAVAMKQNVKGQDIAARYGGEEFAIALPKTALRSAITVADHIRRAVMNKELMKRSSGERLGRLTISIGVALLRPTDTPQSLIERADKCLYAAKRGGRNRVISECDAEADESAKIIPARVA
jgi:diguanylate cyclase (GGDEF)-like protein